MYNKIIVLIFSSLFWSWSQHVQAQCTPGALDSDADGICDIEDMDDDNDGIPDVTEHLFCIATSLTYSWSGIIDGDRDRGQPDILNRDFVFGDDYTFNLNFNDNVKIIIETTIGDQSAPRSGNVIVNGVSEIISTNSGQFQTVIHTPNTGTTFGVKMIGNDMSTTAIVVKAIDGTVLTAFDFGTSSSPLQSGYIKVHASTSPQTTSIDCGVLEDYDNDNIPNSIDTDSDNDGCPDSIEGSAGFTINDIDNAGALIGNVDNTPNSPTYGMPLPVGGGQGLNTSQNANEFSNDNICLCAMSSMPIDSDGDGICDDSDICPVGNDNIDSDNDNISDPCDSCIDVNNNNICDQEDPLRPITINEVIPSNGTVLADNYGEYDDIIEIYNSSNTPVNLAGYYLSDDSNTPLMWQIPTTNVALTTVPAGGYLVFWADGETTQGANHLNFKLSSSGETITLTAPDKTSTIDVLSFPVLDPDDGFGALPDGSTNLSQLIPATPAATNDNSQPKALPPVITPASGLYNTSQTVSITTEPGSSIYYTLDGSNPTTSSTLYTGAFTVSTSQSVRAISFKSGFANSLTETTAYIIGSNHDLPVISINIDPKYMWSDTEGMYVVGTNGTIADCNGPTANYWQEWEHPANVIMLDEAGNEVFDVDGGLSIFGNCSRRYAQKSIQFKTKSKYLSPNIPAQVFPQREQDEYRRLRFRSGGNLWKTTIFGEAVAQRIVENQLDLEIQSARPAIAYINGEYWGIHNIRDAYSKHYFGYKFPKYDGDEFEIMRMRNRHYNVEATDGDTTNLSNLYQYFLNNPTFTQSNYDYAESQIDVNNFLNYYMLQMWLFPLDWPSTASPSNKIYWRSSTSNSKWRMAVLDVDISWTDPSLNAVTYMMVPGTVNERNSPRATMLFRKMMDVSEFRDEFIQRYATQLNLVYDANRVNTLIDDYRNQLDSEIPAHSALWGPQGGLTAYNQWILEVNKLKNYANTRSDNMRTHIANYFGLSTFDLTLNFDANTNGTAVVNSNYFEVPYNYTGEYFTNTQIEIHAIPNPGYRFVRWQETGNTNATIYQSFNSNTTLTPVFEAALDVVINEIHYNPDDTINEKEFIEIHNPDTKARDLSDYEFSEGICFKFPQGTTINPGEYIVIAADATQYAGNGYQVFQWEESKLNNDGEKIWLNNIIGTVIDSVRYNDGIPWSLLADGFGASLELNYPVPADNITASDWHASAPTGGTPGAQNSTPCTSPTDEIVINEINYNSDNLTNPGDWIELHNPTAANIDISNWQFYDSENTFAIPAGTILAPDDFLILAEDAALFGSIFPHLNNGTDYVGNLAFNISNGGERVSLFDQNKCLSDELVFNDKIPWDTIPDGNGPTLSLIDPSFDNILATSWEASSNINSAYGTPGRENTPCPDNNILYPNTICLGVPTTIQADVVYSNMDFTWFVSGAAASSFTADSGTVVWDNPGTYSVQLITRYFECTKVYNQIVTVGNCNTMPNIIDDNFSTNEDNVLSNNVLTNDNDPDNDNLTVNTTPQSPPSNGTLILNPDGTLDYTPNPDFYGTDSFTYQVCDDASFGINTITPGSFSGQVVSGADDVEELSTDGTIEVTSSDLDLTEDSPDIYSAIGIRITNIIVPQGATITSAYLEFVADEAQSVITSLTISAEATGNAAAIPTTNYALTSKNKTNATASWANLPAWTTANIYQSTDISSVIQEIINRNDWSSGNAMTFIIEGTGQRTAESFDGTAPPKLVVNYEVISSGGQVDISLCDVAQVTINITPENDAPQAADDNITVNEDIPGTGNTMNNDSDIEGHNLTANTTPITPPQNGSLFLLSYGLYTYTPNTDFFGTDTFEYEICDDGSPVMCDTASVTIDVTPVNDAPTPAPDALPMFANSSIQDNVLLNDNDIENDNLTATTTPIIAPSNGSVTIQSNGNIDYTPNPNFVGTDSFTYEVCDDGTPTMCNTETVTILIEPDCVDIELAAWLEGAFDPALGEMRNTLVATRKLLPGQTPASNLATPTPAGQPYSIAPWSYAGTEGAGWTDADYTNDETDWVLVSFRTDIQKNTEVGMTAALLKKDGSVDFPDRCALTSMVASPLYIVLEHRNHIGVMTPQPVDVIGSTLTYDFRLGDSYRDQTSFGQKQIPTGEWTMFAGDADQSDFPSFDIKGTDKTIWFDNNGVFDYYLSPDFNLDGDINGQDKSLWFDNNGISSRVPK